MNTFEIKGKDRELKLTYAGVKYLGKVYEGGSIEVIGKALQGDLELFPHILFASVLHLGEDITLKDVEEAVEAAYENETLDMSDIFQLSNELVNDNFFYRKTVQNLMKDNPEALEAMKSLMNPETAETSEND